MGLALKCKTLASMEAGAERTWMCSQRVLNLSAKPMSRAPFNDRTLDNQLLNKYKTALSAATINA